MSTKNPGLWQKWFSRKLERVRAKDRERARRYFFQPAVEPLEDRRLLAVRVWDGGGANALWATPGNWVGDVAPQQDDSLVFPASGARHTNTNNFADGMRFHSVTISASDYAITEENAAANGVTLLDGFVYNAATSGASFTVPVTLGAAQFFYSANLGATITLGDLNLANLQLLSIDGRGNLDVEGVVTGTGGITKYGDGTLILGGNNAQYQGIITAVQGSISARHSNALGTADAGTIMGLGTALVLQGGVNVPENIAIRDQGLGFAMSTLGAIRAVDGTATTPNILSGVVTMTNHGSFGVDPGGYLKVTGQIMVEPGISDGGLAKFGAGTLELAGSEENVITGQTTVVQGTLVLNKDRSGTATPLPFSASLVIGDNRDGITAPEAAVVRLMSRDQIPERNWSKTGINTVTINSTGTLDLNNRNDQIGTLVLFQGRSSAAQVTTGTGVLSLLGDIGVNVNTGDWTKANPFQGSSGASPEAVISGNLDLGAYFSGISGGVSTRTIAVYDTALFNLNPDLTISANISGASYMSLSKTGAGTLRLTGNNTYQGVTRLTAGVVDMGSDTAFGNSSQVSISGGTIRPVSSGVGDPGDRTLSNPLSVDGNFYIYGSNALTFTGAVTVTANDRRISIPDPTQVTTFAGPVGEGVFYGSGITKWGRGELDFTNTVSFTGLLKVGYQGGTANSNSYDGGTVRFLGPNGALARNFTAMEVYNGALILDNTQGNNNDRLPDQLNMSIGGGTLQLIGNSAGTIETLGVVTLAAGLTSAIESDTTGGGTTYLTLGGLSASSNTQASVHFVGGGTPLSASGPNQISLLQTPTNLVYANNVFGTGVVINPDGTPDLATLTGGANGLAVTPLPAAAYVTSTSGLTATSNLKLTTPGTYAIDSASVNAVLLGPGVTLTGTSTTTTLTIANGPIVFGGDAAALSVPYVALNASNTNYVMANGATSTATISSIVTGGNTGQYWEKGGAGKLILSGANQFISVFQLNQGIVTLRDSSALGSPAAATSTYAGTQLQLEGDLTILAEPITVHGVGPYGVPLAQQGGLYALSGDSRIAGTVNLEQGCWLDASTYFPNGGQTMQQSAGIGVAPGATLNLSGVLGYTGGNAAQEWYKFGGGQLELSGTLANTITSTTRVQQGTLLLNKAPGVPATGNMTIFIGDDVSGSATLRLGADNQISSGSTVWVNSNGTFDLNGESQWLTGALNLEIGPLGGGDVIIGSGGTLCVNSDTRVWSFGGGNTQGGATISGGTLTLEIFDYSGGAAQRTWTVNDGAAPTLANPNGVDLTVSSAIADGTGYRSMGIIKAGFGQMQFDGTATNTYTGTTTVNEGTLLLNKTGGALAMSGPLTVGDNSLQSGSVMSDVVQYLQDDQLPDWQALVSVNGTGLLDLNGHNDAIGVADGQPGLSVTSGVVQTGTGTLTLDGDLTTANQFVIGTLPGNYNARVAPLITGNLNLGSSYARTWNIGDASELYVDAVISADLTGSVDLIKQTAGTPVLSGESSGFSGSIYINSNGSNNQPGLLIGSGTALGTGTIYPANTMQIGVDGGPQTIANRFISQDLRFYAGNDLTITGGFDALAGLTITVSAPVNLTLAGGLGEVAPALGVTKSGPGFLNLTGASPISGALSISNDGGAVTLSGGGTLPNISGITVNPGGSLIIDNSGPGNANNDRVRNTAGITLIGAELEFRGSEAAPVSEVLGNITTNATPGGFTSIVTSINQGQPTTLSAHQLTRSAPAVISFRGYGADLGTADNQLFFFNPLVTQLSNGILPFATLAKAGDLDFVGYDLTKGVLAGPYADTLAGATATTNVKLKHNETVSGAIAVNALLVTGATPVTVGGAGLLTIGSGLLVANGAGQTINAPLEFGGATALILTPNFGTTGTAFNTTLDLGGAVDGQQGLAKLGVGRLNLNASSTYAGVTNIYEGVVRITNAGALGAAVNNSPNQGTSVWMGSALEIDGSGGPVNVQNEYLSLGGAGFGYAPATLALGNTNNVPMTGNQGALRNIAGMANYWTGRVDLIGRATTTNYSNITAVGVDADSFLGLWSSISGTTNAWCTVHKVGTGILELDGPTANVFVTGTGEYLYLDEGTLQLNKPAGIYALAGGTPGVATSGYFPIIVGDNVGGRGADVLKWLANDQILDGVMSLTVRGSGKLDLNGFNETVNPTLLLENNLTSGAQVATGTGTLTINNDAYITVNDSQAFGSLLAPTISGTLALAVANDATSHTRQINMADSIATSDLFIAAKITDGDGTATVQNLTLRNLNNNQRTGRLELAPVLPSDFSGSVTFTAQGSPADGRIRVSTNGALGASGTAASCTVVANGDTLELNGVTITDEFLTLTGQNNTGAGSGFVGVWGTLVGLPNTSSTWQQTAAVSGTLVTLSNYPAIAVDTEGFVNLAAAIGGGTGLVKYWPGTLIFSGNTSNTYGGNSIVTRIWEGTLRLAKTGGAYAIAASGAMATPNMLETNGGIDYGIPDDAVVIWDQDFQIAPSAVVRAITASLVDLNGHNESLSNSSVAALEFWTGTIRPHLRTGSGTLTLAGAAGTSGINVNASGQSANSSLLFNQAGAWIEGNLNLGGASRTINTLANSQLQNTLQIDAEVSNGQIVKTNAGTLLLTNGANDYGQASNEVQQLSFFGTIGGGSFTLTYGTNLTTGPINWNATPAQLAANIQAGLNGIFGSGNTLVAPTSATTYSITFQGLLAKANLPQLTVTNSLTGSNATVIAYTVADGSGNEVETVTLGTAAGSFTLAYNGLAATGGALTFTPGSAPTAALVKTHLETISLLAGNVGVVGANGGPFTVVFQNALGGVNVSPLTFSTSAGLTGHAVATVADGGFPNEVQTFTAPTSGSFTFTYRGATTPALAFNLPASSLTANDAATLQGRLESLAGIGTGNVCVSGPIGGPYVITYRGALAGRDLPTLTASAGTIAETLPGGGTLLQVGMLALGSNNVLGFSGLVLRPITATVSGGSWANNTITITTSAAHNLQAGATVTISGVNPGGYNGTYVITGATATTFTVGNNNNPGTWVSGGTVLATMGLRTDASAVTLPNPVDVTVGTATTGSFSVRVSGAQPVTFANSLALHYTGGTIYWESQIPALAQTPSVTLAGTVDLGTSTMGVRTQANNITQISGNIVDTSSSAPGFLVKDSNNAFNSTGVLLLSGNNTFSGTLLVNGGIVRAASAGALGAVNNCVQTFASTSSGGGSFTITFNNEVTAPLTYTATTPPTAAAVAAALNRLPFVMGLADPATGAGPISVSSSTPAGPATTYTLTFGGALAGYNWGVVTVTYLANASQSAAPAITVPGGGVTVAANAALEVGAAGLTIANPITLASVGFNGIPTGGLRLLDVTPNSEEAATMTGMINLTGNAAIGVAGAEDTLTSGSGTLGFILSKSAAAQFSLTKMGLGTLQFAGSNSNYYQGPTNIYQGTLVADKQDPPAGPGARQFAPQALGWGTVTIGNEFGGDNSAVLRYGASAGIDQILGTVNVTVTSSGLLDLATNNKSDFINALTVETGRTYSGDVQTGAGTLTIAGDLTANTYGATSSSAPAATISGKLNFVGGTWDNQNVASLVLVNPTFVPSTNATLTISAALGQVQATGGFVPGLREGTINQNIDLTTQNPATSLALYPRAGETSALPPWAGTQEWIYTGQFYSPSGTVSWGGEIDDNLWMKIDGTVWTPATLVWGNTGTSGPLSLGTGPYGNNWHDIEIRMSNGGGGAGGAANVTGWLGNLFGVGFSPNGTGLPGAANNSAATYGYNYVMPVDNGSMNLFRTPGGTVPFTLNKSGTGNLAITGAASFTGGINVTAGNLIFSGSGSANPIGLGNEVQAVSFGGAVAGGSFTLTYNTKATSAITATAATVAASGIPGASEAGPTVTINTTAAHGFANGDTVVVSGMPGYNGSYVISNVTATSFQYTSPTLGLANAGGGTVLDATLTTANMQAALNTLLGAGNTLVGNPAINVYTITYQGTLANANLPRLTATSSLTGTGATITATTVADGIGREAQTLTLGGTSGGTFTVSFNGVPAAAPLTYDTTGMHPTAAELQAHINSIPRPERVRHRAGYWPLHNRLQHWFERPCVYDDHRRSHRRRRLVVCAAGHLRGCRRHSDPGQSRHERGRPATRHGRRRAQRRHAVVPGQQHRGLDGDRGAVDPHGRSGLHDPR